MSYFFSFNFWDRLEYVHHNHVKKPGLICRRGNDIAPKSNYLFE